MATFVAQDLERLVGRLGAHEVVFVAEHAGERIEVERIVVDNEEAVAHAPAILYDLPMSRIDAIAKIVESQPNDPFPRYGLAMEYKNAGRAEEAHAQFEELRRRHPDYVPQYLMHGNLLASIHRLDDARAVLQAGLAAARKKGDGHAAGEIESALQNLPGDD